jgi:hypothetical protein
MGQDGEAVDLPIVLEPGESRFLAIYVGMLVPGSVYEALSSSNNRKSATTVAEVTKVLGKLGLDLYGNRVDFTEFPDGSYIANIDIQEQNAPAFWFRLTTGQGEVFIGSANHYSNPAS